MSTPERETPSSMTPEERVARYEALRRKSSLSRIFAEHRNPDRVVRWVRDDKNDIALHKHLGFTFAKDNPKKPEEQRQINTVVEISEDGLYRTGDVILMEIDRDAYDFYLNQNSERSRQMMNAGKDAFRSEAAKLEVPTFTRDKSGNVQH